MFDGPLEAQFPGAPVDMGIFTEVITKTTFTENTVTRVTNNMLSLPLIEEVCRPMPAIDPFPFESNHSNVPFSIYIHRQSHCTNLKAL